MTHYTSSTLIGGKRQSWSKFASHYTWGTNGGCECKMDVKSTWIPTWHQMNHVSWSLGLFSKTTSWRWTYHKTRRPWHSKNSQPLIYSILSCVRTRMNRNSLNSIWLRARSHMISQCTCGFVIRLHDDCGGVLGRPLDTFFWALTISWSRLLAHVWSGPKAALSVISCCEVRSHSFDKKINWIV
jgi:hypothetical protein